MNLQFFKYQGAGNDFILVDDRSAVFDVSNQELIEQLCDRRFGIGADGLMLLRSSEAYDFTMLYFNADGREGSMCGNGGRCIVAFANDLGLIKEQTVFDAVDGQHDATISNTRDAYWVSLGMIPVNQIEKIGQDGFLDTGSPHYVRHVEDLTGMDVFQEGKKIRNNERFQLVGTNVNFISVNQDKSLSIRTYERGVEDETLACGTGVTAAAIYAKYVGLLDQTHINVHALGGDLKVSFNENNGCYSNVRLEGPAKFVFKGEINV